MPRLNAPYHRYVQLPEESLHKRESFAKDFGISPKRSPSTPPKFLKATTMADLERDASRGLMKKTVHEMYRVPRVVPADDWEAWVDRVEGVWFPRQPGKITWDLVLMQGILYTCVVVPFRMGMDVPAEGGWLSFEAAVTLFFLADVVANFNTASSPDSIHYVVYRPEIAKLYLKGWFLVDFASSLPVELLQMALRDSTFGDLSSIKMLRALRLLRLLRMLKVLRMQQYIQLVEDSLGVNLQVLMLLKLLVAVIYLMHLLGCVWFYLHLLMSTPHAERPPVAAATSSAADDAALDAYYLDGVDTWLTSYDGGSGLHAGIKVQYLYSIYWALMTLTTVGYGDITPTNDVERVYVLFCLLVGAIVFGFLLSTLGDVLSNVDQNATRIDERLTEVKEYLRWHRVPFATAQAVRKYFEYFYSRRAAVDDEQILGNLTPSLRREVTVHLLTRSVAKIPLFTRRGATNLYCDLAFQLAVHPKLKPLLREAREVVVAKHACNDALYFLSRGVVVASGDLGLTFFALNTPGAFFGENALFETPSHLTCTAQVRCELFTMSTSDVAALALNLSPSGREEFAENVLEEHFRHSIARNVALRLFATGITKALSKTETAAVRMQRGFFVQRLARLAGDEAPALIDLMPVLFGIVKPRRAGAPRRQGDPSELAVVEQPSQTVDMADGSQLDLNKAAAKLMRLRDIFGRANKQRKEARPSRLAQASMGSSLEVPTDADIDGGGEAAMVAGIERRVSESVARTVEATVETAVEQAMHLTRSQVQSEGELMAAAAAGFAELAAGLRRDFEAATARLETQVDAAVVVLRDTAVSSAEAKVSAALGKTDTTGGALGERLDEVVGEIRALASAAVAPMTAALDAKLDAAVEKLRVAALPPPSPRSRSLLSPRSRKA